MYLNMRFVLVSICCVQALLYAEDAVTFHPASAMVRIGGVDGVLPPVSKTYSLELVRGEREGFQLAVCPAGDKPVRIKKIKMTHPVGAHLQTVQLFRVLPVSHTSPDAHPQFVVPARNIGLVPDVLMPLADRDLLADSVPYKAGDVPLTYYIEFSEPTRGETPFGLWLWKLSVECENGTTVEFAINVRIHDVTISKRLPFRTAVQWNWSLEDKYFGRALDLAEKKSYWKFCLDYRLSPCVFFGSSPSPTPAEAAELVEEGLSVICLMQAGNGNPKVFDDAKKKRLIPMLEQWRKDLKKFKLEHDAVILLADEPVAASAENCRQNAEWLKAQCPEVKIWCGTRPSDSWNKFIDLMDPVTAHSTDMYKPHSHQKEAMDIFRRDNPNGEYWWFHSVEPYGPYTNLRLDNKLIEGRVSGWQSAAERVDGYEYFWLTDWSNNKDSKDVAWPERAVKWKTGLSGAGTLCYPDEKGRPMPSLRLVNLRDGLEDWALLEMLSPRASRGEPISEVARVTRSLTDYSTDPNDILKARNAIIERLKKEKR